MSTQNILRFKDSPYQIREASTTAGKATWEVRPKPGKYYPLHDNGENVPENHNHKGHPNPSTPGHPEFTGRRPLSPVRASHEAPQIVHPVPGTSTPHPKQDAALGHQSRIDPATKFMAYEGACQACITALKEDGPEAKLFLKDNCSLLRSMLRVEDILLPISGKDEPGSEQDEEAVVRIPYTLSDDTEEPKTAPRPPPPPVHAQHAFAPLLQVRVRSVRLPKERTRLGSLIGKKADGRHRAVHLKYEGQSVMASIGGGGEITGMTGELQVPEDVHDPRPIVVEMLIEGMPVAGGSLAIKDLAESQREPARYPPSPPSTVFTQTSDKEAVISRWFNTFKSFSTARTAEGFNRRGRWGVRRPSSSPGMNRQPGTWVELTGRDGRPMQVLLECRESLRPPVNENPWEYAEESNNELDSCEPRPSHAVVPVSRHQAYEYLLLSVVEGQGCGPQKLSVENEWKWLLSAFRSLYRISRAYGDMSMLKWIFRSGKPTPTVYCLELVYNMFAPLQDMAGQGSLDPHEKAILNKIAAQIKDLTARVFEDYFSLSTESDTGLLDGGAQTTECPPAALEPAVRLSGLLHNHEDRDTILWLESRFTTAALKKYARLQANCHVERIEGRLQDPSLSYSQPTMPVLSDSDLLQQYKKMRSLCKALTSDIDQDIAIHETQVLPASIKMPGVTASVYCQELKSHLASVTRSCPPTEPQEAFVEMFVGVGDFQKYLEDQGLNRPKGHAANLDALELFSDFIESWITESQEKLCQQCLSLSSNSGFLQGPDGTSGVFQGVSSVVNEMLRHLQEEVKLFERVVCYWTIFAPRLERAICDVVRSIVEAVSHQCGMVKLSPDQESLADRFDTRSLGGQSISQFSMMSAGPLGGRSKGKQVMQWQWHGVSVNVRNPGAGKQQPIVINSHEATLLNSLRRLMVDVPQLEEQMRNWAQGRPTTETQGDDSTEAGILKPKFEEDDDVPHRVGAEFAQLAKELRSQFATAVIMSAERMLSVMNISFRTSITTVLRDSHEHCKSQDALCLRADIQERLSPVTQALNYTLQQLREPLEERVFVSVVRGLWDNASKELYLYVYDLREGEETQAWKSRQNCTFLTELVDNFFKDQLADLLPHTLTPADLETPFHATKVKQMLAQNTTTINRNFSVY
ncbi:hypothetical protein BSKO_05195 [Bryopsis sp. KO-2023]|nr:hypothetical protein BSKO_05195 [Bryopsis sp. KO-2023]